MAFRHYYVFKDDIGKKLGKAGWETLRNGNENAFALEDDKVAYESNCEQRIDYKTYAIKILQMCASNDNFISFGCGKGILEWHMKRQAGDRIRVTCSDYTPQQLEKLKKVFVDCDSFLLFDMLEGDYSQVDKRATVIIYRCSTEFTYKQYRQIFKKMYDRGIETIVFVPTEIITIKQGLRRYKAYAKDLLKGRKLTFCGWNYLEKELVSMFDDYYVIGKAEYIDSSVIWVLNRNKK